MVLHNQETLLRPWSLQGLVWASGSALPPGELFSGCRWPEDSRRVVSTVPPNTLRGSCEQPAAFCLGFLLPPHTLSHHLSLQSQCRANFPSESNCLKKQDWICWRKTPTIFSAGMTESRHVPAPCGYFQHCPCFPHKELKTKPHLPDAKGGCAGSDFPDAQSPN